MVAVLLSVASFLLCLPALAGPAPAPTPELEPGTLAAVTSVVTGAYLVYRLYRGKTRTKN